MRLLIAEDEVLLALCLVEAVEDAGHQVLCCEASAARVMRCAQEKGGDLALVNISLHEGSRAGLQLAEDLRALHRIPSIFVSGQREDAFSARQIALGFLPKPYCYHDVIAAISVAEVLRQGGRPPPPPIPPTLELFS